MTTKKDTNVSIEKVDSKKLLNNLSFCVFDLETTGGDHKKDTIIEIGMVRIEKMKIVAELSFLIDPKRKIPDFIQKLTHISQDDVEGCHTIDEVLDQILEFFGDSILVAHNTSFDVPFFNAVLKKHGRKELKNKSICTYLMTKLLIPNMLTSNLNYMSRLFGIEHQKAHRALDDAYASANLLIKYLHVFIKRNIEKVNHLYYPKNKFELDRITIKNSGNTRQLSSVLKKCTTPFVITAKSENGVIVLCMPIKGSQEEIDFLKATLKKLKWINLTIRIFGQFLEAYTHYNFFFDKISSKEIQEKTISFLWQHHFNNRRPKIKNMKAFSNLLKNKALIITGHIVTGQFYIIPVDKLSPGSELVFRFPGHQKKVQQFINSQLKNKPSKKSFKAQERLKDFSESLIISLANNEKESLIIFTDDNKMELLTKIKKFVDNFKNDSNYPIQSL